MFRYTNASTYFSPQHTLHVHVSSDNAYLYIDYLHWYHIIMNAVLDMCIFYPAHHFCLLYFHLNKYQALILRIFVISLSADYIIHCQDCYLIKGCAASDRNENSHKIFRFQYYFGMPKCWPLVDYLAKS